IVQSYRCDLPIKIRGRLGKVLQDQQDMASPAHLVQEHDPHVIRTHLPSSQSLRLCTKTQMCCLGRRKGRRRASDLLLLGPQWSLRALRICTWAPLHSFLCYQPKTVM
ncbi:mCG145841, partial [Mus musculus]